MLTFAISKGRLAEKIFGMLKKLNICDISVDDEDRRLVITNGDYTFFLALQNRMLCRQPLPKRFRRLSS